MHRTESTFEGFRHFTLSALAESDLATAEALDRIARRGDFALCLKVARNPHVSSSTLEWLGGFNELRLEPGDDLRQLAAAVAASPAISAQTIRNLFARYAGLHAWFWGALIRNADIAPEVLADLLQSDNLSLVSLAARHPSTPAPDLDAFARRVITAGDDGLDSLVGVGSRSAAWDLRMAILLSLSSNPSLPHEIMRWMAGESDALCAAGVRTPLEIWKRLMMNPGVPVWLVGNLVRRADSRTFPVASNVNVFAGRRYTSAEIAELFRWLPYNDVANFAAARKRWEQRMKDQPEVVDVLRHNWKLIYKWLAAHPLAEFRVLLARQIDLPAELTERLLRDKYVTVRRAVTGSAKKSGV